MSSITCTAMAKEKGNQNIPCNQFTHCEECNNGDSSIRWIVYHFTTFSNRNDYPLRLDLEEDKYSKIKIGWEEIAQQYFKYNRREAKRDVIGNR